MQHSPALLKWSVCFPSVGQSGQLEWLSGHCQCGGHHSDLLYHRTICRCQVRHQGPENWCRLQSIHVRSFCTVLIFCLKSKCCSFCICIYLVNSMKCSSYCDLCSGWIHLVLEKSLCTGLLEPDTHPCGSLESLSAFVTSEWLLNGYITLKTL